jgi:MoaA/NifB/PqqE/SkfB family radical SAM enzyme
MISKDKLNLFLSPTTRCNAHCPQCHRNDKNTLKTRSDLPLISWTLEEVKEILPPDVIANCKFLKVCGTWGDPMLCKEIFEIVDYLLDYIPAWGMISIDTNGSMGNDDWWWKFGKMVSRPRASHIFKNKTVKKKIEVVFDIDGIDQEMHERYRVDTNLEKILNNMEILSNSLCKVRSQSILFKHNVDHKDQIKDMSYEYGSESHSSIVSNRFEYNSDGNPIPFYYGPNNSLMMEKADVDDNFKKNAVVSRTNVSELTDKVSCIWDKDNTLYISSNGLVLPCCYFGNNFFMTRYIEHRPDKYSNHVIDEYDIDTHDLHKNHLFDIIDNSPWFNNVLPDSIENNPCDTCKKNCKKTPYNQIRLVEKQ